VADQQGYEGNAFPHKHTAFFAREKYRQSLAYLGTMSGKSLQPEALFFTQNAFKKRLAIGPAGRGTYSAPRTPNLYLRGLFEAGRDKRGREEIISPTNYSWICHCWPLRANM